MKKFAIALAATAALTTSAFAADLPAREPVYKAAPPPAPILSWTGCYVGAGGGYGMWNQDNNVFHADGTFDSATQTAGGRGWFGTVQVGCDYQVAPSWLIGVFGDYDFSSIKGDLGTLNHSLLGREKLSSKWAAGARLGYVVFPQMLAYVSGGWTQARFDGVNFIDTNGDEGSFMGARTYSGWFIGTGYEYRLAFFSPNLTWKTEYRYAEYGSKRNTVFFNDGDVHILLDSKKFTQEIRSELVWRFNWGPY